MYVCKINYLIYKESYFFRPRKECGVGSCNELSQRSKSAVQDLGHHSYRLEASPYADQHLRYVLDCLNTIHTSL